MEENWNPNSFYLADVAGDSRQPEHITESLFTLFVVLTHFMP